MTKVPRLILLVLLLPSALAAQAPYVPGALQEWRQWVLDDREYRECPFYFDRQGQRPDDFVCAWPGRLALDAGAAAASFSVRWSVYAGEQWLPLPGSTDHWPHAVTVDGRAATVVLRDGQPSLRLGPGEYLVAGRFEWAERPGILPLPASIGLLDLSINGTAVARPERSGNGVFLGERRRETTERDALRVEAYRRIVDEVPTRLQTLLRIEVAGGVREATLAPVLPAGFVPLSLASGLPARLAPDGTLTVQLRPGSWVIDIGARAESVVGSIRMAEPQANMPAVEIWSFAASERYRIAAAEGLPPVDPAQADVPPGWRQLPAFRAETGGELTLVERSRGTTAVDNELRLARQLWLDFGGDGFIVSDSIDGTMRVDWRLDMQPPYALLNAAEEGANLLITAGSDDGETGVELRRSAVDLDTIARIDARGEFAVTGWDGRFASAGAVVHLPPGHKLLAAPGVDRAPGSWVSQWQLLDFFLLLIITIASWRLLGRTAGLVALAALILSFHELQAPAWLWLNLLIAIALARVTPPGLLQRSVRGYGAVSALLLLVALVPFVASQLRIAIYPQLERQFGVVMPRTAADESMMDAAAPMPGEALEEIVVTGNRDREAGKLQSARISSSMSMSLPAQGQASAGPDRGYSYSRYAPNAVVQAGPGRPAWRWNSYRLDWSGPVEPDQAMRLVILPRWSVTLLRCVEVVLLLAFAGLLIARLLNRSLPLPGFGKPGGVAAAAILLLGLLPGLPQAANAETPGPELLRELERRLLEPPDCVPRCAEIIAASIDIAGDEARLVLTVHALAEVAVPLPGSEQGWRPSAVSIDGVAATRVLRAPDQSLWARFAAGRHTVTLRGALPAADSVEIAFPAPPRFVAVSSDGWLVTGVKDRRLLSGSLQLTRLRAEADADGTARWESSRFPAFVTVSRRLHLDLDWSVTTTVERVAPETGALTLEIPLLDGESVLTEGMTVTDGKALVAMGPEQRSRSWTSSLQRADTLTLEAAADAAWQEIWEVGVGSSWHAEFSGVPESETGQDLGAARLAQFLPRGGEQLRIAASRPAAVAGNTLAFDRVQLDVEPGMRSQATRMQLDYRSTRGAQHVITLPEAAEVTEVVIDGKVEPLRARGRELTVPILPGAHSLQLAWRSDAAIETRTRTPAVDIGAPASNIDLNLELPGNRWLLATTGPALAPAVLYWSELAVLLVFAVILGRIGLAPLQTRHWILLGLGFSTFSWAVLGWVVLWLLVCAVRERWQDQDAPAWQFNAVQVVVAGMTVTALLAIVASLPVGLLGSPDMQVTGNGSTGNSLRWFADRSSAALPTATAWSVPLWVYKALILAWALWLSFALLRWLPWVWRCFSSHGFWRGREAAA